LETVVKFLADQVQQHPTFAAWLVALITVAVLVTNGCRLAYPNFSEMPRSVRFIVGFLDPIALNFWNLARKAEPDLKGQYRVEGEPNAESPKS